MNNKTWSYPDYEIINGNIILDSEILAKDFNIAERLLRHDTYDAFNSTDDAALAFLLMTMPKTHINNIEYGSYINKVSYGGQDYYYFSVLVCGGHANVLPHVFLTYSTGNYRNYDRFDSVLIGAEKILLSNPVSVAFVHTHPSCECHRGNQFSDVDKWIVDSDVFPNIESIYLGTPSGQMIRYDSSGRTVTVTSNLPVAQIKFPRAKPDYAW